MGIKDLPKPGANFKLNIGPGSFKRKLASATRYGDLKNLSDNKEVITKVLSNNYYSTKIKRGGFNRLDKLYAWRKIKSLDKNITKEDKREIKKILEHLGEKNSAGSSVAADNKFKSQKSEGRGVFSSLLLGPKKKEQFKVNKALMAKDTSALEEITSVRGGRFFLKERSDKDKILGSSGGGLKGTASRVGIRQPNVATSVFTAKNVKKPEIGGGKFSKSINLPPLK